MLTSLSTILLIGTHATGAEETITTDPAEEKLAVTGSRIKQSDSEGTLPVTVITRQQIDASGATNVPDVLRNSPLNSFGSDQPQSGSNAQALATINLRGLGSNRTLVLVDGHRAAKAPFASGSADLNAIPLAAVDHIEILRDGASAIYGSDAIGGVVNVITRKNFEGSELRYGKSRPQHDGGATEEASLAFGAAQDKGSVFAGMAYSSREIVYDRNRQYSRHDLSRYGNNWAELEDAFTPIQAVENGCQGEGLVLTEDDLCKYDFAKVKSTGASLNNVALFANGTYQIDAHASIYANGTIENIRSFGLFAVANDTLLIPEGHQNADGQNDNPFGRDMLVLHRYIALGPRNTDTNALNEDLLYGVKLSYGKSDYDFGARLNDYSFIGTGRNFVNRRAAAQLVADGSYDFVHPINTSLDVLDQIRTETTQNSMFKNREVFGNLQTSLFHAGDGDAMLSVGAELRTDHYQDHYDALTVSGGVGGTNVSPSQGDRRTTAEYTELLLPLSKTLEIDLAARHDHYSDYGGDTVPKFSIAYHPISGMIWRASYGKGFHAPDMDVISIAPSQGFDIVYTDPATCVYQGFNRDCFDGDIPSAAEITSYTKKNPELKSEHSTQWSSGVVWDARDWLTLSLDYYHIRLFGSIQSLGVEDLLEASKSGKGIPNGLALIREDRQRCAGSDFLPEPDGVIDQCDPIVAAIVGYGNISRQSTNGLDLGVTTQFHFAAGSLKNNLSIEQVRNYEVSGSGNLAGLADGDAAYPEYRSQLTNSLSAGALTVHWSVNYISGYQQRLSGTKEHVSSWATHTVQLDWTLSSSTAANLGIGNVFDHTPPVDASTSASYNTKLYNDFERDFYLRITHSF